MSETAAPVFDRSKYTARLVLRQLTAGGNAWGAETVLQAATDPRFRVPLAVLRAGNEAGCAEQMREILAA